MKSLILVVLSVFLIGCGGGGGGGGESAPVKIPVENNLNVPLLSPINTPINLGKNIVVIGDSISEGHPFLHGRLHPIIDLSKSNEYGQISYVLEAQLGSTVLNNGIGGQTSTDIINRWNNDVLNENPDIVFIHVGINDFYRGISIAEMKNNFLWMIQSCTDNNLKCIFSNIGGVMEISDILKSKIMSVNNWLDLQEIDLIDYLNWQSGNKNDPQIFRKYLFYDSVHPNKEGYMDYGLYIIQNSTILQDLINIKE